MNINELIARLTLARDNGIHTITTTDDQEPFLLAIDGQLVIGSEEACVEYAANLSGDEV